jgi:hypothetical protein
MFDPANDSRWWMISRYRIRHVYGKCNRLSTSDAVPSPGEVCPQRRAWGLGSVSFEGVQGYALITLHTGSHEAVIKTGRARNKFESSCLDNHNNRAGPRREVLLPGILGILRSSTSVSEGHTCHGTLLRRWSQPLWLITNLWLATMLATSFTKILYSWEIWFTQYLLLASIHQLLMFVSHYRQSR